ncbi:hypothetical protein, partial [Parasphingorhabdus sp.]
EEFSKYLNYINSIDSDQREKFDKRQLDDVREDLARYGSAAKGDVLVDGVGAVCLPVKTLANQETLVIGVVGPSKRIAQCADQHRQTIARLAKEHGIKTSFKLK